VNIQEYISSGIVESYVLGLADETDRTEFEQFCTTHPEVKAARTTFEMELEQFALANATAAPAGLRAVILEQTAGSPVIAASQEEMLAPVVGIRPWVRTLAAAAVILFIGSAILNIYFYNKYRESSTAYDRLLAQQTDLVKNNNNLQTRLEAREQTISRLSNPNMKMIKMAGDAVPAKGSPDSSSMAMVYWDTHSKDVYLMVHHLPQPAADKQYQLWAIVNGQPVDAGVFDMQDTSGMMKMKNIPDAQLFAVTLEQKGGSPVPKGPMYVLGKT
jgi:anti-sigma-K factor RskA